MSEMIGLYKSCEGMGSACRMVREFLRAPIGMVKGNVTGTAPKVSYLLLEAAKLTCAIVKATLVPSRNSISAVATDTLVQRAELDACCAFLFQINSNTALATILDQGTKPFGNRNRSIDHNADCFGQTPNVGCLRHE